MLPQTPQDAAKRRLAPLWARLLAYLLARLLAWQAEHEYNAPSGHGKSSATHPSLQSIAQTPSALEGRCFCLGELGAQSDEKTIGRPVCPPAIPWGYQGHRTGCPSSRCGTQRQCRAAVPPRGRRMEPRPPSVPWRRFEATAGTGKESPPQQALINNGCGQ